MGRKSGLCLVLWCAEFNIVWSFLESYSKLSSTTFSQGQTASTQVAAPWRSVCNESAGWSICQTPHCQYVSLDPRIPVSLKKKFGETVYSLSLISLSVRRTISQRQFSPIIIVIQTPYHLLHLYHSAFPEGRDMIAPSWTPTRLSEINLKGFDLHKIILRHCDLLWAHKWIFLMLHSIESFSFLLSSFPSLFYIFIYFLEQS